MRRAPRTRAGRPSQTRVAYTWSPASSPCGSWTPTSYTGIGVVSPRPESARGSRDPCRSQARKILAPSLSGPRPVIPSWPANGTRRSDDPQGEAYALLLADYCHHWNRAMPFMFEREGDFTNCLSRPACWPTTRILNRALKVLTADVCKDVEVDRLAVPVLHLRTARTRSSLDSRRTRRPTPLKSCGNPALHPALDRPLSRGELYRASLARSADPNHGWPT